MGQKRSSGTQPRMEVGRVNRRQPQCLASHVEGIKQKKGGGERKREGRDNGLESTRSTAQRKKRGGWEVRLKSISPEGSSLHA